MAKSLVHVLMGHYPAGGSPKTVSQFFENYNAGKQFLKIFKLKRKWKF